MNKFRKKTLQIITFVIILLPILSVSTIQILGYLQNDPTRMDANAVLVFNENFDDTTLMDPMTNAVGWGTGTVTGERDFQVLPLDFLETPHDARGLAIQGRKAYIVFYNYSSTFDSFGCIDLNDPTNLRLLSTRHSFYGMTSIAIDGDILYVGKTSVPLATYNQLGTYNASKAFNLGVGGYFLDHYTVDGAVTDIDPEGHLVYFTSYNDISGRSLRITDAEDPDNLREITPNWNNEKALGLEVTSHYAYIAASDEGLYVLNISNKHQPVEIGYLNLPGNATDVLIDGNTAYVTLGLAGVAAVDIRNPTAPTVLDIYDTIGIARKLALQGNTLFIADGFGGVSVFDVADRFHISFVLNIGLPNTWDVGLYGGVLVVATDAGIHTFQCSATGGGIADFATSYYENTFSDLDVWDIRVVGDIAYIAGGSDGFYTLNVQDPKNPTLLDHFTTPFTSFRKIDVNGQFAYLVGRTNMSIFEISNPNNIQLKHTDSGNNLGDVFVNGETVYVTWMAGGMAIFNVTYTNQFDFSYELSEPHFGTNITSVWVSGYHIYTVNNFGGGGDGIFVHNQIDMTAPYLTDSRSYSAYEQDLYVDGDIAFSADSSWCVLHNVSDPYNLGYIGDLRNGTGGSFVDTNAIWGFGPYAIAAGPDGTFLVDTTDFSTFSASWYTPTSDALAVTISGDYTYIANKTSLIILRHFKSAADTYTDGFRFAQSTAIFTAPTHGAIKSATLTFDGWVPTDTIIQFSLSLDASNWEVVTPAILHTFTGEGQNLYYRIEIVYEDDRSPHLYEIEITLNYSNLVFDISDPLWIGILAGAGALLLIIIVVITVVSIKKKKKVTTR